MNYDDIEMPIYAKTAELGEKGIRMISSIVEEEFHWIFRQNVKNDIGIDGEIEIVTDSRKGTGKLIAMQIKCGESYFKEENEEGYVFRPRIATVNYWLNLSIPVIVCLCNPITNKIFWRHITVESVKKVDKNYKIVMPFANIFSIENKFEIERVSNSTVQIDEIVDAALFRYLYERFKRAILICPLMEEPRDFHNLSYIAEINDELYMIGTVIDKYGYIDCNELKEKIKLYHENRRSCGWSLDSSNIESKFLICFVSESKENLLLKDDVLSILNDNSSDVKYNCLRLSKEYISLTLLDNDGNDIYFFDDNERI